MPENMAALRSGALDVVQLFQPFAEELIASGEGHLWYAAADSRAVLLHELLRHDAARSPRNATRC